VRSFTFRITCRFAVLVTGTTAAVLVLGGLLLDREMENSLSVLHDIEVRELAELLGLDDTLTAAEISSRIKHDADSDAALFVMQVADARGNVLFRSENLGQTILPANMGTNGHATTVVPLLGRVHLSGYAVGPWQILIGSPLEPGERVLRSYIRIGVPLLVGVGLASMALGYAFSRATLRPIRAIESTARRIRADNLAERIPVPPGRDELASLTQLLNQTFDGLEASFEQVRRFAADASHELKTPLALIRLNIEKLRSRPNTDAETAAALSEVLEEIARLHQVMDRLLFLAKAESGAVPLVLQPSEMAEFVGSFAEDARALAEDRDVRFTVTENEPGELRVDRNLLRQLLLNLIANAVAASPPGGLVQLKSHLADGEWRLEIVDDGPGIAASELSRVFNRFVRLQRSIEQSPAGHGLGLAICRSIAELHGGTIRAENRFERRGLRVIVTLPAFRQATPP
jgi:signal transduction histidine kinase